MSDTPRYAGRIDVPYWTNMPEPAPIGPGVIRSILLNKFEREPFLALIAQKGVDPVAYQQRLMESCGVTDEDIARADEPVLAAEALIAALQRRADEDTL